MLPRSVAEVGTHYADLQSGIAQDALSELAAPLRRGRRSPESWRDAIQSAARTLLSLQLLSASYADAYLNDVLDAQGANPDAEGQVVPQSFVDLTDGGGSWLQALVFAPNSVRPSNGDWTRFEFVANSIVKTGLGDTARSSVQSGMQARPAVKGYVRMLRGTSCARCAILAGRRYKSAVAFKRHKRCFPAGVVVSGPATLASTRRWYEGELVVLSTSSGQELSLTGNHPVLTSRGWVPANLLQEGDEVVRSIRPEGATPLVVPDHHQVPTLIEDVWRSLRVAGFDRMPTTAEDFHGDGQNGEVDVVGADSSLGDWGQAAIVEPVLQLLLAGRVAGSGRFAGESTAHLLDLREPPHPGGTIGWPNLSPPFLGVHLGDADLSSFTGAAPWYAGCGEPLGDHPTGHPVLAGEPVLASPREVGRDDRVSGDILGLTRWDAPGNSFSVETREGYAAFGADLFNRLAGQVELDRVVQLRRVEWSGHVYGLTSSEGWHVANSLIVSNCDCVHIPAAENAEGWTTNPKTYFRSLAAGDQDRLFTKSGAEAIRRGADMSQVVNASKGVAVAQAFGQTARVTTEGTTRRGLAGQRLQGVPRLLPDEIFLQAERLGWDRLEVLRQLQRFGYIL